MHNIITMERILVIDDDESLRDTIGMMLEQEGFRAVLSGDGRDGFDKAITSKPDLILVDLRLPGMSGVDICKQLRAGMAGLLNNRIIDHSSSPESGCRISSGVTIRGVKRSNSKLT